MHDTGIFYSENTLEPNTTHLVSVLKSETNLDVFIGFAQDVQTIYIHGYLTQRESSEIRDALQQAWIKQYSGNFSAEYCPDKRTIEQCYV